MNVVPCFGEHKVKFDASKRYCSQFKFVVVDEKKMADGLKKLRGKLEEEACKFVPARYRKYLRYDISVRRVPEESIASWEYNPEQGIATIMSKDTYGVVKGKRR